MSKQIFAVIHVLNPAQAFENFRVAEGTGCDGAFLISHGEVSPNTLWDIYFNIRRLSSRLTLGINQLGYSTSLCMSEAYHKGRSEGFGVSLLWADNYKYTHEGQPQSRPDAVRDYQTRIHKDSLVFYGGVAFKHQPEEHMRGAALAREGKESLQYVDVVTTSGVQTGTAPDLQKICTLRDALGPEAKLAVASGVTPENIELFLPYVDSFLVSTGISKDFYTLDPVKTHQLVRRVRQ